MPIAAFNLKVFAEDLSIVLAFAGDSTINKF